MSIAIPCLIKQPHRQQLSGLIVGDKPDGMASLRGCSFDVKVADKVMKLSLHHGHLTDLIQFALQSKLSKMQR